MYSAQAGIMWGADTSDLLNVRTRQLASLRTVDYRSLWMLSEQSNHCAVNTHWMRLLRLAKQGALQWRV